MRRAITAALATAEVLVFARPALAQAPVALVEEVRGHPADVEFMDYVRASKVIRLGPRELIVLSYLASCWRETITGGTVTVGTEQSDVQGGKVARAKVPCDGGRISLTPGQANQSAGTIFRSTTLEAPLTLYGVSPVVDATAGDALLIVRTDQRGEHHLTTMPKRPGTQRSYLDLARVRMILTPGGTYRASIGTREIVFRVDPAARSSGVPIISRLLRFRGAN